MDQNSPKNHPDGLKASWRNKLGITEKLPKIADEFHPSSEDAATSQEPREAPPIAASQPRPGAPISRPAPMAPRAPAATPPMDFGERIRQQREAAERMAEQRVAEAKERAAQERNAATPGFLSTAPQNAQKPRFTFADEELKQAHQDTVGHAAVAGRQSRPIFTAERPQRAPEAGQRPAVAAPRPSAPPPGSFQPRPGAAPATGRAQPAFHPASHQHPRSTEPQWRPPQPVPPREGYRRDVPVTGQVPEKGYAEPQGFRGPPRRPEAPRDRNDYRGAHARELAYVEEESEDLFEDDRGGQQQRRRAGAQDYAQAYQEYDGPETEEPRRRTGPFLLLAALLVVAAVAGGLIYFYQRSVGTEAGTGAVPVVAEPAQSPKTAPEAGQVTDETLAPEGGETQQASPDPTLQTPAQKKQIYDRILGDTTQDETNQLAPSEEQPIVPNPTGDSDLEPIPLPEPPQPGDTQGQSGSLQQPQALQSARAGVSQPAAGAPDETSSVASVESVTESEASEASAPSPATAPPPTAAGQGTAQVSDSAALNVTPEPAPIEEPPGPELVTGSTTADPPSPPAPVPQQQVAAADTSGADASTITGSGPISLLPGTASNAPQAAGSSIGDPPATPAFLPDIASPAPVASATRRTGTRAGDRFVSSANTNFNRSNQGQQQVAIIEPDVLTGTITPAEPAALPDTPAVATTLPAPDPIQPQPSAPAATGTPSGYVLQLASYKSEAEARADYERLRQRHGTIIGGLAPEVVKTDLTSGGTFYRLSLGPVDSRQTARTLCNSLLAAGERDCLAKAR